jgi:hypothetical protein
MLNFEFGVAEENAFNFLDKEELDRLRKSLEEAKAPLRMLDFFCATRYHTTTPNGKRKSLKFDYVLLRFTFHRRNMQLFLVHEKGTQHIPLEDLATFLTNRINRELTQTQQKPLTLRYVHPVYDHEKLI